MTGSGPVVAAVGGNALARPDQPMTVQEERANAGRAARQLASLAGHGLVVTHGNGPQVGALALAASMAGWAVPLHLLVAQSQGHVGHLLQRELAAVLPGRSTVCVLSHVVVDPADDGLVRPTKPIGPAMSASEAERMVAAHGWQVVAHRDRWHRVVASPDPQRILECAEIATLLERGSVVVACGGGGVPVVVDPDGGWIGMDAVVDKDLTSARLAETLQAASLVLLTDVDGVYDRWGDPRGSGVISRARVGDLAASSFEAGTMGPKVEAACRFVAATGRSAHIGALDDAEAVAAGRSGTTIEP